MALTNALFNTGLDAMAGDIDSVSLHESNPDPDGSNEVSGGSYARQTPTWDAASGGTVSIGSSLSFDVPGGSTVAYVGLWDSTGPDWKGSIQLDSSESFSGDGTFSVTSLAITLSNS